MNLGRDARRWELDLVGSGAYLNRVAYLTRGRRLGQRRMRPWAAPMGDSSVFREQRRRFEHATCARRGDRRHTAPADCLDSCALPRCGQAAPATVVAKGWSLTECWWLVDLGGRLLLVVLLPKRRLRRARMSWNPGLIPPAEAAPRTSSSTVSEFLRRARVDGLEANCAAGARPACSGCEGSWPRVTLVGNPSGTVFALCGRSASLEASSVPSKAPACPL